jgi:hypothetical protein
VKDVYVGHTTNFVQRKHAHKQSCINEKSLNNKCKLYDVIRNNGGWVNWNMEIINFFNCKTHYEARIKEQEYFVLLNANLNSIEPMPPKKPKLVISTPIELNNDDISNESILKDSKYAKKFVCKKCDFNCCKESDYTRHITTRKHIKRINPNENAQNNAELKKYICTCSREYKHQSSLCNHKKNCNNEEKEKEEKEEDHNDVANNSNLLLEILKQNQIMLEKNSSENNNSLILDLLKQNQDFKNLMIEQNKYMMEQSKQMMELVKKIS